SITRMSHAYYDGHAEWYERSFATGKRASAPREAAVRLLGPGSGRLLDVGCGTGAHTAAFAERGWRVVGVDLSADQLRLARARGGAVLHAAAGGLRLRTD